MSSSKLLNLLNAKFLIVKIGIIYQRVTVRIHRNSEHQVLSGVPSIGKVPKLLASLYIIIIIVLGPGPFELLVQVMKM